MNTVKIDKRNTLMVAHRGLSGIEKENTLPAFVAAANRSYFGIETDVHMTRDGKYVVIHDETTSRVAKTNVIIEKTDYSEIKNIELYDICGKKTRTDLRIPLLSEYIRICKRYEKTAVLELKTPFTKEQVKQIVDIIKSEKYLDGVIFISFHRQDLIYLREICPDSPAQFLTGDINKENIDFMKKYRLDLDCQHKSLTEDNVKALHSLGLKINAWTVDDPKAGERLASWGVDYITTNILE